MRTPQALPGVATASHVVVLLMYVALCVDPLGPQAVQGHAHPAGPARGGHGVARRRAAHVRGALRRPAWPPGCTRTCAPRTPCPGWPRRRTSSCCSCTWRSASTRLAPRLYKDMRTPQALPGVATASHVVVLLM